MQEEIKNEEILETPSVEKTEEVSNVENVSTAVSENKEDSRARRPLSRRPNSRNNNNRSRTQREKPEFEQKVLSVRRVTRVTTGGRRFSLHTTMVIGDRNGRVGLGTGKALDTQGSMEKAFKDARKRLIKLPIDEKKTVKYDCIGKHDAAKVWISPNNEKGLIAGSSARVILSLAGLQNVTSKFNGGTKNKLNNARATMNALMKLAIKK